MHVINILLDSILPTFIIINYHSDSMKYKKLFKNNFKPIDITSTYARLLRDSDTYTVYYHSARQSSYRLLVINDSSCMIKV